MQTSRNGEIGLECDGELVEEAFSCRRCVCDEHASLCGVVHTVCSVDQLTNLQDSSPHGALATSDGCTAFSVVEQLVHDDRATQTEQTELHAANVQ